MKKVVILCASVVCATLVNAATCFWTATNIKLVSPTDTITSYVAYLCDASVMGSTALASAIETGNAGSALATTGLVQKSIAVTESGSVSQYNFGSYTASQEYTMYMLVLDATDATEAQNYFVTDDVTKTAPTAGFLSMTFGDQSNATWTAVPEPTSGLLLLVGGALLALKRKHV